MKIIRSVRKQQEVSKHNRLKGLTIGFVPTMGALHEGHLSLIRRSKKENDVTLLSIFVNPTQFGPKEDFNAYPRPTARDARLARSAGADIIFLPAVSAMYPADHSTSIIIDRITDGVLCGGSRPGHFKGVATVVAKLLNIVNPDVMYLGQKDAQQCVVLKRLVKDLNFPARVCVCPTVREPDGLAMSSRNQYLTPNERQEAVCLYQALKLAQQEVRHGNYSTNRILRVVRQHIKNNSSGRIEYLAVVDPESLRPLATVGKKALLALAVRFGRARLIDNAIISTYNV